MFAKAKLYLTYPECTVVEFLTNRLDSEAVRNRVLPFLQKHPCLARNILLLQERAIGVSGDNSRAANLAVLLQNGEWPFWFCRQ